MQFPTLLHSIDCAVLEDGFHGAFQLFSGVFVLLAWRVRDHAWITASMAAEQRRRLPGRHPEGDVQP